MINDVIYEASSLPEDYIPLSYGLIIIEVTECMNGTFFQCLFHQHGHINEMLVYELEFSSIGQLIVNEHPQGMRSK